jgi:hypothetical protein
LIIISIIEISPYVSGSLFAVGSSRSQFATMKSRAKIVATINAFIFGRELEIGN